ncbi:hypothetical protein I8748_15815 [Nostoc sp. CENA67]|uniref:Uncharacterized protein n=1 Tax=Amazonocrinis nigriterrae CENA67 TaxID=2794033 RepID=A0A8J7HWJ7_9NOST|nr:hypothetical protein [Amazonocrinis nigriterrae CENA67]
MREIRRPCLKPLILIMGFPAPHAYPSHPSHKYVKMLLIGKKQDGCDR